MVKAGLPVALFAGPAAFCFAGELPWVFPRNLSDLGTALAERCGFDAGEPVLPRAPSAGLPRARGSESGALGVLRAGVGPIGFFVRCVVPTGTIATVISSRS